MTNTGNTLGQVLTGMNYDPAGQRIKNQTYDFDDIGNSKQTHTQKTTQSQWGRRRPLTIHQEEQYQVNPINQYQQITTTQGYRPTTKNYQYDADGNLTQDHQWNYEWNGENRLIAMETREETNRKRIEFRYDPQGRRLSKTVKNQIRSRYSRPERTGHRTINKCD